MGPRSMRLGTGSERPEAWLRSATTVLRFAHPLSQLPCPQAKPKGDQHHQPDDELQNRYGPEPDQLDEGPIEGCPHIDKNQDGRVWMTVK